MISIKNVILPNKPLNNFELEDAVNRLKIPCFRGVFLLDTLPKKLNKKECGIVNFDKTLITLVVLERIGSLGIKMGEIKFTLIVMVCNLLQKL